MQSRLAPDVNAWIFVSALLQQASERADRLAALLPRGIPAETDQYVAASLPKAMPKLSLEGVVALPKSAVCSQPLRDGCAVLSALIWKNEFPATNRSLSWATAFVAISASTPPSLTSTLSLIVIELMGTPRDHVLQKTSMRNMRTASSGDSRTNCEKSKAVKLRARHWVLLFVRNSR